MARPTAIRLPGVCQPRGLLIAARRILTAPERIESWTSPVLERLVPPWPELRRPAELDRVAVALVVGADAGGEGAADGAQEGRGDLRRFLGQLVEGGSGDLDDGAVGIGDDVRGARAVIEQGDVPEEVPGA